MRSDASPVDRAALADYLAGARIAGNVATSRGNNLGNYRRLAARDPGYTFGLTIGEEWDFAAILDLMAKRCGVSPDPRHDDGDDTIDPQRTVAQLDAMADLLGEAARARSRVLIATGHPTGLLAVHVEIAAALRAAGCALLRPSASWRDESSHVMPLHRHVRYLGGVAVATQGAHLLHTHSPEPMERMLQHLTATHEPWPDVVVADHGYAGAAGAAGITSVGFADSNDPALFVGEAQDDVAVCVPLDDNVEPHLYAPMSAYLVARINAAAG